ncbi:MAG: DNA primase [Defluviitaleaceae bacterium]|nr:DNA primase [Defluviitaleaceae bacterium]
MLYGQDVISEVKALNDIVDVVSGYVRLTPRSGNYFGVCPFHNEKTPSFSANREKQIFYCFGCGAGGNVISFIKRIENMDFPDALKLLADRVHFNLPQKGTSTQSKIKAAEREKTAELNKRAARFYYDCLYEEAGKAARTYLDDRGISTEITRRFGLGLAPDAWDGLMKKFPDVTPQEFEKAGLVKQNPKRNDHYYDRFRNRLMFPIIDHRGRVIGFGGRILEQSDESAKYLNSPETALFHKSECLYGLNHAKKTRATEIIIVEGYMDVITMHLHGFTNTVGVLGTALKNTHARLIKNTGASTVILLLDSDEAGLRAVQRAIPVLIKEGLRVKILSLEDAKDPDEYLSRFGAGKFASILSESKTHITFQIEQVRKNYNMQTTEGRVGFTQESAKILASIPSEIEKDAYVNLVANETDISPSAINMEIEKIMGILRKNSEYYLNPRTVIAKKAGEDIGLKNAKKALLNLVFLYPSAAAALQKSQQLTAQEMGEDIFAKLLEIAFTSTVKSPSDIIDLFESDDEQQVVAEIFAEIKEYTSQSDVEKALSDMAKKIKLTWLNNRIEIEKDDANAVNTLLLQKKNTNTLNITLADG